MVVGGGGGSVCVCITVRWVYASLFTCRNGVILPVPSPRCNHTG